MNIRFRIVSLEPVGSLLVRVQRLLQVTQLNLVHLSKILLLCCCAAQVAAKYVVLNSTGENADSVLGVCLAVDLEGFLQGVGSVIGLVEILGLDGGGFFKGKTGFLV